MKVNERWGFTILVIIITFGFALVYGVANTRGYDDGHFDGENGYSRYNLREYSPYYDSIGGYMDNEIHSENYDGLLDGTILNLQSME